MWHVGGLSVSNGAPWKRETFESVLFMYTMQARIVFLKRNRYACKRLVVRDNEHWNFNICVRNPTWCQLQTHAQTHSSVRPRKRGGVHIVGLQETNSAHALASWTISNMIESAKNYLYDRRRGLSKTVGILGGVYLVGRYISERLEEVKEKVIQEKSARNR